MNDSPPVRTPTETPGVFTGVDAAPMQQFRLAATIYFMWSAVVWLSAASGISTLPTSAAATILFGISATNVTLFLIARTDPLHQPPPDTYALAQCVFGIAWTTVYAFLSSGNEMIVIGIFASILLFALLRVSRGTLNQVALFATIAYGLVYSMKGLSSDAGIPVSVILNQLLVFGGIMACVSLAGDRMYRLRHRLEAERDALQVAMTNVEPAARSRSMNRNYILDLLGREKGRTDRTNIPFAICLFNIDSLPSASADSDKRKAQLKGVEIRLRNELRAMDALHPTGFHDCFGPHNDDEYVAILPQTNLRGAQRGAERVVATLTQSPADGSESIAVCAGVAEYRRGEDISDLLGRADEALKRARRTESSRVCVSARKESHQADIVRLNPGRT